MLKIWGRTNSVNVKKALWATEELGLAYQRIDAGMEHGVTRTPEYMRMNPNSLVPTIEDDGFVLWESHSIVRYLAAKHGAGRLWPTDLRRRAHAERWLDLTNAFQRELQRRGHRIVTLDDYNQFGSGQLIWKLDGGYFAASDPRRDGQAVGF